MPESKKDLLENPNSKLGGLGVDLIQKNVTGTAFKKAGEALATALPRLGPLIGRAAPVVDTALELGKGAYLMGKQGAREGHAESGKELMDDPFWYQASNAYLNPADAASKYGAAIEADDRKDFERKNMLAPNDPMRVAFENAAVERVRAENQQKYLDEARRALDPDFDLEERTMDLVRSITRPLPSLTD
jgi:hypothetical protein